MENIDSKLPRFMPTNSAICTLRSRQLNMEGHSISLGGNAPMRTRLPSPPSPPSTNQHKLLLALQEALKVGTRIQPPALPIRGRLGRGAAPQRPTR